MRSRGASAPPIERLVPAAFTIPTEAPESDGTLEWRSTTMVVVEAFGGGAHGVGFSYTDASAALLIRDRLAPLVCGRSAMDVGGAWEQMIRAVRNVGRTGLASMAIAAVDTALWDLKARLLSVPLVSLLGAVRSAVPVYASGGFTSYSIPQLEHWLHRAADELGATRFKVKVGRVPDDDPARVRAARAAVGDTAALYVDANGAYSRRQALAMATHLAEAGVSWYEEPVSSDDVRGLRWLRDRLPPGVALAAGEYGSDLTDFRRLLEEDAVDVLMPDATRCAGFTGFLEAGALCAAYGIEMSAHTAPALHLHACCALRAIRDLEWFHDHARVERFLFDGVVQPVNGMLEPDMGRPGLGLELKHVDAKRFAA